MESDNVAVELAKLRERIATARKDIDCHDEQIEKHADRISSLEKKLVFVSGLAAGGGGLLGAILGKGFSMLGQ